MGELSEFSLKDRLFLMTYRWRRVDPVPWAPLERPLSEGRLALVSTAGLVLPGQESFDDSVKGGDPSLRWIPDDADLGELRDTHRSESFDHSGMLRDPNLVFPVDRLHELVERGRVGSANRRHISLMGSITAPGRLIRDTAPEMAEGLVADGVEAALLVPV